MDGPDGELAASLRYLSQRYSMPTDRAKATLNDIGTEERVPRSYHYIEIEKTLAINAIVFFQFPLFNSCNN